MYYGRPLQAIASLADVFDGDQTLVLGTLNSLGAANLFQGANPTPGTQVTVPGYLPGQQRFDPFNPFLANRTNFLQVSPILLVISAIDKNFQYGYTQQANLSIERQVGASMKASATYKLHQRNATAAPAQQ